VNRPGNFLTFTNPETKTVVNRPANFFTCTKPAMKSVSDVGSHLFTILMASKYGMHLGQFLATSCAACGIPPAVDLSHQHVAEWPCAKLCLQGRTQEFVLEGASTPQTHCWSDFHDRPTWTHNMCGQSYTHLHINRHVSYIYSDTATAFYYQI